MIEISGLTKRFGKRTAVDNLTFTVEPGHITGFLGPNGAGKSTTMRMIVELETPNAGFALIDGMRYRDLNNPLCTVGALLNTNCMHPRRSGRNHLRYMAASNDIPMNRVEECLALVGLTEVASQPTKSYSLGMRQRLGMAEAMLGNPRYLLFDEPVNGLDPEGIAWFRRFAKNLAAEGRGILVSSHLLAEISQTADRLVVLGQGKLLANTSIAEFEKQAPTRVRARTKFAPQLVRILAEAGLSAAVDPTDTSSDSSLGTAVIVDADNTSVVADLAAKNNIPLYELVVIGASVEDVYLQMTQDWEQYRSGGTSLTTNGNGQEAK
ncbi:ATP-binding cassette domain-containing protein [Lawsonella clevelandensis]|jgi:ABC transporter related protein|uniref:Export ABC transporter ATP-binding protein n=2 Tax=Bacillati TaxID=1783272 RepID=A0A2W5IFF4_9ACTN|nr:ATP-binding cassette domain-containing protein [Lawsonella clevelandensis]PZP89104.1 MAG: export ABC transporter ATP-binding protein [Lawsonella clevelandensis]